MTKLLFLRYVGKSCTDCGSTTRALAQISPKVWLCQTDVRERKRAKKRRAQAKRSEKVFGITLEEKEQIVEFQGGGCICADWTGYRGQTRSLSTDHDHKTRVVRGALCKHCNDLVGRVGDDPAYFERMAYYLRNPPAVRLLGERVVPEG